MRLNDMTHMAEIFNTPLLPYKKFLVTHGKHRAAWVGSAGLSDHYHAMYKFPCGTEVSVISGPLFYCSSDAPYEYRINAQEPVGHVTDEELFILLTKIVAGEKPRSNNGADDEEKNNFHSFEHTPFPGPEGYAINKLRNNEAHPSKKVTQRP